MQETSKMDIHENVVSCDYIEACPKGYSFKGHNGARYMIVYYTYATEWTDREHRIFGRTIEAVMKKYNQATGRAGDIQDADGNSGGISTEELAYMVEL